MNFSNKLHDLAVDFIDQPQTLGQGYLLDVCTPRQVGKSTALSRLSLKFDPYLAIAHNCHLSRQLNLNGMSDKWCSFDNFRNSYNKKSPRQARVIVLCDELSMLQLDTLSYELLTAHRINPQWLRIVSFRTLAS